jgi:hypothetical protein
VIQISNQEIPIHKFLLSSQSEILLNLLENETLVNLEEDVEVFKLFLEYLYTKQFEKKNLNQKN